MVRGLLLIYVVVELAAILALSATVGWGWTLLALLVTAVLGVVVWVPMAGWQLGAQVVQLRSGVKEPGSALSDGAMVSLATVLILVPGLVTTALGILLLAPPIRTLARPALAAIALRGVQRRIPLITDVRMFDDASGATDHRDYIDGEVVDVRDVEPAVLPPAQVRAAPHQHAP
ncbi:membrane protein FxsA [Mycobacterium sp. 852002-51163_SCH5372311]|uniref:FxsA family protein n=1 Tax=Mycobacterium sp. 852002-51163_SCH5372311 TaxID=1834097 RepID=UPI0008019C75|nr:FxsA family protein [Mycobacterium sp. 852002-51163_SCH5372311]OBF83749.1 membrane protein FxsA [Mycobacterium sp. 852002-51163_SCH5372311]